MDQLTYNEHRDIVIDCVGVVIFVLDNFGDRATLFSAFGGSDGVLSGHNCYAWGNLAGGAVSGCLVNFNSQKNKLKKREKFQILEN